jgi:competence protein ComEC
LRDPLLAVFIALAGGVAAARFVPFGARELVWAIAGLTALAILGALQKTRRGALAAGFAALFFAGALVAVLHRPGAAPEADAGGREVVILGGCVVGPSVFSEDREQFTLELAPHARARVSLYGKPGEPQPDLGYGQNVELEGKLRRARNFRNPGAFDFVAYLARQEIYWTASGRAASVRVLPGRCGSRFWKPIFDLRGAALNQLQKLNRGDSYRTGMLQAILIGETANLDKVWTDHFRRTGTYHTLVISGLHVTVLAGSFLFLLRLCFVPEVPALIATMFGTWIYALVSGCQAPAVRSAAGLTLFIVARYFFRRGRLLNILAAIASVLIVLDPEQLFEASFQLSFLAVAVIGALATPVIERTSGPLARGLKNLADVDRDLRMEPRAANLRVELRLVAETLSLWTRVSERICLGAAGLVLRGLFFAYELIVVSAVIQFGLALPMAVYFHRLSLTGLTANLFVVPLMCAVVPVGFAAIFTGWKFIAVIAGWLLAASEWIAAMHVRWEPQWRIPDPPLWLAMLFVASILGLALLRRRGWALCLSLAILAVLIVHPLAPQVERGVFEATSIDVGQGDSLFLAFPDGRQALLDGGGVAAMGLHRKARLDIGEDVVSPYLWTRSIRRLDVIILSHPHEDHIGGLPAVVDNFRPRELWIGSVADTPEWRHLRSEALRCGVRIVHLESGMHFHYGGTAVEVLAPAHDHEPSETAPNNDSLVLRVCYGSRSFLFTGDIERRVESELVAAGLAHSDVLKVAHHGSKTSSGAPFLDLVRPTFAVISDGFENSFGMPHEAVLGRLAERHAAVLRTDQCGLVSLKSDGRRIRFESGCYQERW